MSTTLSQNVAAFGLVIDHLEAHARDDFDPERSDNE